MDRQYTLRSRRIVFEKELKRLQNLMYGGTVPVWPYMTNRAGEYSEEQTMALIGQLLAGAPPDTDEERAAFLKNILYCVLRAMTSGYTEYHMGNVSGFKEPEMITFLDVLSGSEEPFLELLDYTVVYFMKTLYEIFTRREIDLTLLHTEIVSSEITEDMRKQMDEEADARTVMEDAFAKEQGFDMEAVRAEEQKELEQSKLLEAQERERIRDTFAAQEHFCRSLDEICAYLKENKEKPARLQSDIRDLIHHFLWDKALTVFEKEDEFVQVMVQLKKTVRTAQRFAED